MSDGLSTPPWRKPAGNLAAIYGGAFRPREPEPDLGTHAGYALAYARLGWLVVPLYTIEDGRCTCGKAACQSPGKHPQWAADLPHGLKHATTDEVTIAAWWSRWPEANIGIVCGPESGLFAIDIDPRNGGEATWDGIVAELGARPDTVEAQTGGGGLHFLFRYPAGQRIANGKLGPGVDVKGAGGYIVVEPSDHLSGTAYVWEESSDPLHGQALADAPAALLERLVTPERQPEPAGGDGYVHPLNEAEVRSALGVLSPDGYEDWVTIGQALHSTGDERAFGWWDDWSQGSAKYRPGETRRKWRSFTAGGGVSHRTLFAMAKAAGWVEPARAPLYQPAQESGTQGGIQLLTVAELLARPRPVWTVDEVIPESGVGMVYGSPGAGKTFMALDLALAVARGLGQWMGRSVKQGGVVYVAAEGNLRDRLHAYLQHHKLATGDLDALRIVDASINLLDPAAPAALSAAVELVMHDGVRLVVFDTLNRSMPGGDENGGDDMSRVIDAAAGLARRHGCAVIFIHHPGKDAARGARGHSSLLGAVDFELQALRDGDHRQVHVTKEREAPDDYPLGAFELAYIALGHKTEYDPSADPEATYGSCILLPTDTRQRPAEQPTKAGKFPTTAYEQLKRALGDKDARLTLPTSLHDQCERPPRDGQWVCRVDDWKRHIQLVGGLSDGESASAERQAFGRAKTALRDGGFIDICGDFVWLRERDKT